MQLPQLHYIFAQYDRLAWTAAYLSSLPRSSEPFYSWYIVCFRPAIMSDNPQRAFRDVLSSIGEHTPVLWFNCIGPSRCRPLYHCNYHATTHNLCSPYISKFIENFDDECKEEEGFTSSSHRQGQGQKPGQGKVANEVINRSGRFRGGQNKNPTGLRSPGGSDNTKGQSPTPSLTSSQSASSLAPKMPPLPASPSLSQSIASDEGGNAPPQQSYNGAGDPLAVYNLPRSKPLWLNNAYAKQIVKGNFMTLSAKPKTVEMGEWIAHQGKQSLSSII